MPLGPALQLSISDKLCGLPAKGCAEPCQPGQGRLVPGWGGGESCKAAQRGSAAAPAPGRAELEREEWLPGQKRAFYCQQLAQCEPASISEVLRWCAWVLGGEKRTGCLWAHPTSFECLPLV